MANDIHMSEPKADVLPPDGVPDSTSKNEEPVGQATGAAAATGGTEGSNGLEGVDEAVVDEVSFYFAAGVLLCANPLVAKATRIHPIAVTIAPLLSTQAFLYRYTSSDTYPCTPLLWMPYS